jgi:hypothetical protein
VTLPTSGPYNEFGSSLLPEEEGDPLRTGLPAFWWPSVWGLATLVFSAFWMVESWRAAKSLLGPTKAYHLTQDIGGLVFTLACCWAIYQFWKPRSRTLGLIFCALVAAIAMTWHRL